MKHIYSNIIPTETLKALNHEYDREYLFSEDFLNTKVLKGTGPG